LLYHSFFKRFYQPDSEILAPAAFGEASQNSAA